MLAFALSLLAAGSAGVFTRYGLEALIHFPRFTALPTLLANVLGCGIAGLVLKAPITQDVRSVLLVGFCGGLTTFSSLIVQLSQRMQSQLYQEAFIYFGASVVLGFAAVWFGMWVSQLFGW